MLAYGEKVCSCCGKEKELNNFLSTKNEHMNKTIPMCKSCLSKCYKDFLDKFDKNEPAAIWCTCSEIGVPFINEVWVATQSEIEMNKGKPGKPKDGVLIYLSFFNDYVKKTDMEIWSFCQTDIMLDELTKVQKSEEFYKDPEERRLDWGYYKDEDAYDFLEYEFSKYTAGLEDMNFALVSRYRDLCKAEWRKRKADEEENAADSSKAQKDITDLMKLLKIDNFQEDNSKDEIHKFLEYNIWEIENTRPAECEDLEKYRDYCGGKKLIDSLMRPFRNLLAGTRDYPNITKE